MLLQSDRLKTNNCYYKFTRLIDLDENINEPIVFPNTRNSDVFNLVDYTHDYAFKLDELLLGDNPLFINILLIICDLRSVVFLRFLYKLLTYKIPY